MGTQKITEFVVFKCERCGKYNSSMSLLLKRHNNIREILHFGILKRIRLTCRYCGHRTRLKREREQGLSTEVIFCDTIQDARMIVKEKNKGL